MGKIVKGIGGVLFGKQAKSGSTEQSGNSNNDLLKSAYGGANGIGLTGQAGGLLSSLLGGNTQALDNVSNAGGMKWMQEQGMKGIESNKAAAGLLNSGSYGTALADYNHGLTSTYLHNYMSDVNDMGKLGLGAGGILADSGKQSTGSSTNKGGKKGIAGDIIAAVAKCDRRLKENIELIGRMEDGLGFYRWDYKKGHDLPEGKHVGFMADEVKELRPAAYLPNVLGEYAGVDLNRI